MFMFMEVWIPSFLLSLDVRVKVYFTLEDATEAQSRSRDIALLFRYPRRGLGWVVNATPRPLYSREHQGVYRRLGGPQGRSGRVRKISPPPGFDPRSTSPNESLYRLYFFCCGIWPIPGHGLFLTGFTIILRHATHDRNPLDGDRSDVKMST
jgi:hypothetical protein